MVMQHIDTDNVKVAASLAAPALTLFGVSVEDWTFILSAIVSIFFIIEKLPMFIVRMKAFTKWMIEVFKNLKK